MTAQAKFTGTISVPLTMAMLGFRAFSSFFGGIRWTRITPGPFGFSVVWSTSEKVVSIYSRIRRTVFVFLNSLGMGIMLSSFSHSGRPAVSRITVSMGSQVSGSAIL